MKTRLALAVVLALVGACTSMGRLDKEAGLESDRESVFILGVAPENYRISAFPGSVKDGRFHQNPLRPAAVFGAPEDGYVVGKAAAGDTLAITFIRRVKDKDSILGADFAPCAENKTMTFAIPGGKVLYLGNIEYEFAGKALNVRYSQDVAAAKKYVDEHYPRLRGRLEPWKYDLLPTDAPCTRTIYVPVYTSR
jgi:hypothetical protein